MGTTQTAKQQIAQGLVSGTVPTPSHIAWGTGTTDFDESDTALDSELVRNAYDSATATDTVVEWTGIMTEAQGNGSDITEAGLFDASSGGNLFIRDTFPAVSKTSAFEIETVFRMRIL